MKKALQLYCAYGLAAFQREQHENWLKLFIRAFLLRKWIKVQIEAVALKVQGKTVA